MDQVMLGLYGYGAIGAVIAVVFLLWGFGRVDEASHGAWLVRPLLIPGLVILWPMVLLRWITLERGRRTAP